MTTEPRTWKISFHGSSTVITVKAASHDDAKRKVLRKPGAHALPPIFSVVLQD